MPRQRRGMVGSTAAACLLALAWLPLRAAEEPKPETLAVRAGRLILVAGAEIENGVVLVRDGKITAVGQGLAIPTGAKVIEAKVVMPGLVEPHTWRGMDSPNENVPVVPFVSTADGFDPLHFDIEDARREGITTIQVIQGNNTVIGGTGIVVKPLGSTIEEVVARRPGAMKISLNPSGGRNRMAQLRELRRAFEDSDTYLERRAEQKRRGETEEEFDPKQQAMLDLKEGRLTAFIFCPRASDVPKAIELIETRKLKAVLVLGPDTYKAAPLIAEKKLPVILDSQLVVWETDEDREQEIRHDVPLEFHRAGVRFALQAQSNAYTGSHLWYQAASAIQSGVPRADALRAVTLTPAEAIGMADRVGSIEVGKDADLLLLTGDPFDVQTWVETVLIGGKVAYERKSDARLRKLLTGKEPGDGR